jgi:hypothetical protein
MSTEVACSSIGGVLWPCGPQILGREHSFRTFKKVLAFVLRWDFPLKVMLSLLLRSSFLISMAV